MDYAKLAELLYEGEQCIGVQDKELGDLLSVVLTIMIRRGFVIPSFVNTFCAPQQAPLS